MKILLVQPPLDPTTSKIAALGMAEPLGLEYVAAALPEHEVVICDLRAGGRLVDAVNDMGPRIVGTTSVSVTLRQAIELLRQTKRIDPEITTVLGGVHATLLPADCQVDGVDVIVRGEGEKTMAELVHALERGASLENVNGLVYRSSDGWHATRPRQLGPLDEYPFPARHLTEHYRVAYSRVGLGRAVFVASSRGCSRRCTFCSVWRTHDGKYRARSPGNVVAELASRDEPCVDLVDDDSFGNARRMEQLCDLVKHEVPGRTFKALVRADMVVNQPGLFERWAGVGLKFLIIGLESFRDEELKDFDKRASAEQNKQAIAILRQLGINVIGYLIVRPEYTGDDFQRLGDAVEELGIAQPVFTTLTPLPGTVLFEQVRDRLTTLDWSDFDGFRAVLPTALPIREFYRQLAGLYRRAYGRHSLTSEATDVPWHEQLANWIESIDSTN